ncbi:MAG: hypothetical protein ACKERF_00345 [Candidatus Hodgkinia cicadicola]
MQCLLSHAEASAVFDWGERKRHFGRGKCVLRRESRSDELNEPRERVQRDAKAGRMAIFQVGNMKPKPDGSLRTFNRANPRRTLTCERPSGGGDSV